MRIAAKIAAGAAAVGFALAASAGLGPPSASAQDARFAEFTWTMPDRFGHHAPADRRLYPQSPGEVDGGPFFVDVALQRDACRRGASRRFFVGGTETAAEQLGDCRFRLTFRREGSYELEVRVGSGGVEDRATERVVVQDLLIVSIGDSVASGEGNPDNRSFVNPFWQNRRCHRSALAGTARAAATIEAADRQSSVTFVHLACSGATVPKGLTGPYRGVQPGVFERFRKLDPQLDQLRGVASKREVDAVLLSVGANDVGFAAIVRFCLTHSSCVDDLIEPQTLDLGKGRKRPLREAMAASLAQLPERYASVDARLPDDLPSKRVYAVEYFDMTHADRATLCGAILRFIGRDEVRWAYDEVLGPLNDRLFDAARKHRWTYVGGVAREFAGHGYCTGEARWVRRLDESLWQQGFNHKGTLHPNEAGHRATGALIGARLREDLLPRRQVRLPRSPEAQDKLALASTGAVPAALAEAAPAGVRNSEDGEADVLGVDLDEPLLLWIVGPLLGGCLSYRTCPPARPSPRIRGW